MLLEVQEGEAVVDRCVGAAGEHQLDRLVEAVGADEFGAGLLGELAEVARQRLSGLLALQVSEALDAVVVGTGDEHGLGSDIGLGEVVLLLAGIGDADLIDDGVVALGVETGDQAVPLALDKLRLDAELGGNRFADLDVEAHQLVALVMIGERRIGAFRADLQDPCGLDGVEIFAGMGGSKGCSGDEGCGGDGLEEFHFRVSILEEFNDG